MKILITGSSGILGSELVKILSKNHEIIPGNRNFFDILDERKMQDFLEKNHIDILINTAAFTDVYSAEKAGNSENTENYRLNALAVGNLAKLSEKYHFFLMHISTDYVFDGEKIGEYLPNDTKNPLNCYGKAKSDGEDLIQIFAKNFCIIRTEWLYNSDKNANHFVGKIYKKIQNHEKIFAIHDNFGRPTFVGDLANAIFQMLECKDFFEKFQGKIMHLTASGKRASWYDIACEIAKYKGREGLVNMVSYQDFEDIVKRPINSCLYNDSEFLLSDWKISLKKVLESF